MNISKTITVQHPWWGAIFTGLKTVEGRPAPIEKHASWNGGFVDVLSPDGDSVRVRVLDVRHYDTLDEYLDAEGWKVAMPNLMSRDEVVKAYLTIKNEEGVAIFAPERVARVGGINAIVIRTV